MARDAAIRTAPARNWLTIMRTCGLPKGAPVDPVSRWLLISRACVQPMTLTSAAIAGILAWNHPDFTGLAFALAAIGIVLAHAANNMINDYFDLASGLDTESYPRHMYSPHPVIAGLITRAGLRTAILLLNAAGAAIMFYLFVMRGWPVIAFAVTGLFISVFYVAPPLRFKARGLGEPSVLLIWGPLMVGGTYFASTGEAPPGVFAASLPYGLLAATVLMGKHIDKMPWDRPANVRTLPLILGEAEARGTTLGLMVGFYALVGSLVIARVTSFWTLLVVLALPVFRRTLRTYSRPPPTQPPRTYPLWPLWYGPWAFLHARRAGALFVAGLLLGTVFSR